jgi:hypothetical protein
MRKNLMLSEGSNKIRSPSQINYDYQTIRITKSRIDKGLLAIPISLSEFFPTTNRKVKLFLDEEDKSQLNNFSSYKSSTNESRIGGLKDWFDKNGIKDGEELVIHTD